MMDYKKILKKMISNNEKLSIPIFLIPPSATRRDNYISLRHEGHIFSKVKTYGVVEVFSTPTASPHTQSLVKKEIFEEKSKLVYGVNSTLPNNFNKLSHVPPQIIVWWNIVSDKHKYLKKSDFYIISLLNLASKKKALLGISKEIETSIDLIKFFNEDIIIWGSWGK